MLKHYTSNRDIFILIEDGIPTGTTIFNESIPNNSICFNKFTGDYFTLTGSTWFQKNNSGLSVKYTEQSFSAQSTTTISHGWGLKPNVRVIDNNGHELDPTIRWVDENGDISNNHVTIIFNNPTSFRVILDGGTSEKIPESAYQPTAPRKYGIELSDLTNLSASTVDDNLIDLSWTNPHDSFRRNVKVVVLGDSFSDGIGASSPIIQWTSLLRDELQDRYTNAELVNLGISDYTTYHIMPDDYSKSGRPSPDTNANITAALSENPDIVVVNMTSNDMDEGYDPAEYLDNMKDIYDICVSNNIELFLTDTAPRNLNTTKRSNLSIVAQSLKYEYGDRVIPIYDAFNDGRGRINEYDSGDGIHVNDDGHYIIKQQAADTIHNYLLKYAEVQLISVEQSTDSGSTWSVAANINGSRTSYRARNLTPDTRYDFRVRAIPFNNFSTTNYSNVDNAITLQDQGPQLLFSDDFNDNDLHQNYIVANPDTVIAETNQRLEFQQLAGANTAWGDNTIERAIDVENSGFCTLQFDFSNIQPSAGDQQIVLVGLLGENGRQIVFYTNPNDYNSVHAALMSGPSTVSENSETGTLFTGSAGSSYRIQYNLFNQEVHFYENNGDGYFEVWEMKTFDLGDNVRFYATTSNSTSQTDETAIVYIDNVEFWNDALSDSGTGTDTGGGGGGSGNTPFSDDFNDNTLNANYSVTSPNNIIFEQNNRLEFLTVAGLDNTWDEDVIVRDVDIFTEGVASLEFDMDNVDPASDDQTITIVGLRGSNGRQAVFYSLNSPYDGLAAAIMDGPSSVNSNSEGTYQGTMGSRFRIDYSFTGTTLTFYEDSGSGFTEVWTEQTFDMGNNVRFFASPGHIGSQTDDNAIVYVDNVDLSDVS